jgi:type I restriction enzyme S subunit
MTNHCPSIALPEIGMNGNWPRVQLGAILRRADRFERKQPLTEYQFAGTYSFARGIFVGKRKLGSTFGLDKLQRIRSGDFIYCKIMAWEGAFGVAPPETDGCVMSGAFVLYEFERNLADPRFLDWYFRLPSVWHTIGSQSTGTNVRRRSLDPLDFESSTVPLPPLAEQRRIVSRIEKLASKVAEASRLQKEVTAQMDALCRALIINPPDGVSTPTDMNELLTLREPEVNVEATHSYQFAGVYCFGRGVFPGQRKEGSEFAYRSLTKIKRGDFVYPKLMAWEGALGVVRDDCDSLYVSPEFPVFEVRQDRVLPEVLDTYFRIPSVWPELAAISTGTNVRRRRLHPKAFLRYKFPLPSMKIQLEFRRVKRRVDAAKRIQSETAAELDALMPSILSSAFRGEL